VSVSLPEVGLQLTTLSDRISTQVRTLSLGVLAMAWLFLSKDKSAPQLSISQHEVQLAGIALLAILALVSDLVQYQIGYRYTLRHLRDAERTNATSVTYDKKDLAYKARSAFFYAKQSFVALAAGWLVLLLVLSVFG